MQNIKYTFLLLLITACLGACNLNNNADAPRLIQSEISGKTMGTTFHISVVHSPENVIDTAKAEQSIQRFLHTLNQQVSIYIPQSGIRQFNRSESTDWQSVDAHFLTLVEHAQTVSAETNGAFDISVSPLIEAWGFGASEAPSSPSAEKITQAMQQIGYQKLQVNSQQNALKKQHPKLQLDLSAIAKGYAVDKISENLSQQGFPNHLVEIGGELYASGTNQHAKPWRIAIEQPDTQESRVTNSVVVRNLGVATSGDYRNYYIENGIRRSHIIDPQTGYPIRHQLASVTVLHTSTMLADAYATAILVMGQERGKVFANKHKLAVFMIIREADGFSTWSNSDAFTALR